MFTMAISPRGNFLDLIYHLIQTKYKRSTVALSLSLSLSLSLTHTHTHTHTYIYICGIIDISTHPGLQSFQIHLVYCHSTIINCTPPVLTTASPISFCRLVVYLFPFSNFTIVFLFLVSSHDQSSQGFTTQLSPVGTSLCTQVTSPRLS